MIALRQREFYRFTKYIVAVLSDLRLSIFIALCLALGGTSLYVQTLKIPLYYISVGLIGHALLTKKRSLKKLLCPSIILGGILIGLYCLYVIPLPPIFWGQLSGRELVIESFARTDNVLPWLPLSLVPRITYESIFSFLPIIAIVLTMQLSASETEIRNAEKSIIALAIISFLIGLTEVLLGIHIFTVYEFYSQGFPVGVFTNINHQATLSSIALSLAVFFTLKTRLSSSGKNNLHFLWGGAGVILLVLSLILTRSSAGYLFLCVNLSLSFLIMMQGKKHSFMFIIPLLVMLLTLVVDFVFFESHLQNILVKITSQSETSRKQIFTTSIEAGKSLGFFGAGPGSFDAIYRIFENQGVLTQKYVNEAHNEYIQIWIEFGMLGIVWVFAAFIWFLLKVKHLVLGTSSPKKEHLIYALCILTVALHSIVDFPLRTIAMSAIFTFLIVRFDGFRSGSV